MIAAAAIGLCAVGGSAHGVRATPRPSVARRDGGRRVEVRAEKVPGLGRVLTDGAGFVLYAYVPDRQGRSRCFGFCAAIWPPLLVPAGGRVVPGRGADGALLGTVARGDGRRQVTYHHWPLYFYRLDHRPGEANGQGDDMGLWYVLTPRGRIDRATAPAGAS